MKLRRIGALLMAAVLTAGVLAGCGGGSSSSSSSAPADSTKEEASESSGGGSKVTIWATGSDNVRQIFEKLVEDFNNNSE